MNAEAASPANARPAGANVRSLFVIETCRELTLRKEWSWRATPDNDEYYVYAIAR